MTYIDVHSHSAAAQNTDTVTVVNNGPASGLFSAGLHPWHLSPENLEDSLTALEKRLQSSSCAALGETGLDKICGTLWPLQQEAFLRQIKLVEIYSKPIIIHCVKAYQEIIAAKNESSVPWIFHGFRGSAEMAESLTKKGIYISFGAALLDLENGNLREVFRAAALNHIFLETDESSFPIVDIYHEAANLKGISIDELTDAIKNNFIKVFGDILK
ncbi:MAG: hypothetical protein A2020_02760 [Lentisphaerae bacterium GWF2_45_14]|nr:MAG: hypothetical protein A2020_02760 [Lentisphaerae bacterium GWF2_45_14]